MPIQRKYDFEAGTVEDMEVPAVAFDKPRANVTVISRRQFFQQAAISELIEKPEALAAVKSGAIPEVMQVFIASLPEEAQFDAEMLISGAQSFDRNHGVSIAFGAALGKDAAFLDAFWLAASQLK